MSGTATLRAQAEKGSSYDDPSDGVLLMLLQEIETGPGTFVIVERTSDRTGQTYAQALRLDDGSYVVEHREGDAEHHYGTTAADLSAAHKLLVGWAFELPGWSDTATWSPVVV